MKKEQMLDLWEARFEKILVREADTLDYYKKLLKRHSHLLAGTGWRRILRKFVADEDNHVELSAKLVELIKKHKQEQDTARRSLSRLSFSPDSKSQRVKHPIFSG